jgi:membrane-associated phospholipid phosphatase
MLSPRGRTWLVVLSAGVFLVTLDVFVQGPLVSLDRWAAKLDGLDRWPQLEEVAFVYDHAGQRSVLVPILLVVAGVLARRHRTWRPVVLAIFSFLCLNLVVGAMKVLIGRGHTETGNLDVLTGGVLYPSGHSSNMVLTGGLIIYLLRRYTDDPPVRTLVVVVSFLTLLTGLTSLYIFQHWLTDLIAGMLVGGLLLQAVIIFDRATPRPVYEPFVDGVCRRFPPLRRWLRTWTSEGRPVDDGAVDERPAHDRSAPGRPRDDRQDRALVLGRFEADGHRVDAVPVPGRRLGGVVEDVPEMGPAAAAPHLRAPHAE